MPKIESLTYPAIALSDAIEVSDRIAKEFRGNISVAGLAEALGMAEKGGGFIDKVASLREYGLVEGRGTLRVTALGQRIALPHATHEADRARGEAFLGVDLFERLYERTGGRVPEEDSFAIFLSDVTGADRIDVAKKASKIRRLFADGVQYARTAREQDVEAGSESGVAEARPSRGPSQPVEQRADTLEFFAGDIELRLPRSIQSIEVIKGVLEMLSTQIKDEQKENVSNG